MDAEVYDSGPERFCYASVLMGHEGGATSLIEFGMGLARPSPALTGFFLEATEGCAFVEGKSIKVVPREASPFEIPVRKNQSAKTDTTRFIETVLGTGTPLASLEDNRRAMEICLACTRSSLQKKRVLLT